MALSITDLREVAKLLVANGESSDNDKPDRRLILAAPEHVAVNPWRDSPEGKAWLEEVLANCRELEELMAGANCLEARDPLSRSKRASRARQSIDPEGNTGMIDDLDLENGEEE